LNYGITYKTNAELNPTGYVDSDFADYKDICESDQSGLQEIPQLNYNMEYVTTHLQEIPQKIR